MKAGFVTGANAKIKVGNVTLAYCTDVSYNVTVQTIPIESMGKYEVHSNEPVAYTVDGALSVIRYTSRAATSNIDDAAASGNAPGNILANTTTDLQDYIDPRTILEARTFDLDIFEKVQEGNAGPTGSNHVYRIEDCRLTRRGATLNKRGVLVDQYAFVAILASDQDLSDRVSHSSMAAGKDLS